MRVTKAELVQKLNKIKGIVPKTIRPLVVFVFGRIVVFGKRRLFNRKQLGNDR